MRISSSYLSSPWEVSICDALVSNGKIDCSSRHNLFCKPCLSDNQISILTEIVEEYQNRNFFQLSSPLPLSLRSSFIENETELSLFQRAYFRMKCIQDKYWCQ